ncbi:MAG: hypothetical protein AAGF90_17120, partial [Pseudomonadota bacterium]
MDGELVFTVRRPEWLRWTIIGGVVVLAALTFSIALRASAEAPAVLVSASVFAGALIWFGHALWRAPARAVTFDGATLRDDAGEILCTLEEIVEVERGLTLYKPSNGFALKVKGG